MNAAKFITATNTPQADTIILALQRLDDEAKKAVVTILTQEARRWRRVQLAIDDALRQQEAEQRELDAWIDAEEARHADQYALSKEGNATYWTQ